MVRSEKRQGDLKKKGGTKICKTSFRARKCRGKDVELEKSRFCIVGYNVKELEGGWGKKFYAVLKYQSERKNQQTRKCRHKVGKLSPELHGGDFGPKRRVGRGKEQDKDPI